MGEVTDAVIAFAHVFSISDDEELENNRQRRIGDHIGNMKTLT